MANLTVKDLPEDLHEAIRQAARAEGRSLNSYIIDVLAHDAQERARRKRMRDSRAGLRAFVGSLPRLKADSVELIREDRNRRS